LLNRGAKSEAPALALRGEIRGCGAFFVICTKNSTPPTG
jgi:hypothetical protein